MNSIGVVKDVTVNLSRNLSITVQISDGQYCIELATLWLGSGGMYKLDYLRMLVTNISARSGKLLSNYRPTFHPRRVTIAGRDVARME